MLLFLTNCRLCAQQLCASPLPDWLLPSEENYEALRDTGDRHDIYDTLHYLPLGAADSNRYLSIGGQQREWYETFSTPPLGNGPTDSNGYLLQRYMMHFDLHLTSRVRFFFDLKGALEDGRTGGPRPDVDEDRGDFNQAFVEVALRERPAGNLTLRIGRQELLFGSGRLVDMREGPNVRRGFDGAKLTYCSARWRVDAFAARPTQNRPGALDDVPAHGTSFAGVYATFSGPILPKSNIDTYYFFFDQQASVYARGVGREQRHTVGTRFWRAGGEGWDYDWEFIDQFGRFASSGIQAWGVSTNTGYTFKTVNWGPRAGFKTGVASGDSGAAHQDLGTLNPLFASLHYFGEEGLAGPSNFYDVRPEFEVHPSKKTRTTFGSDWFWRKSLNDGIYLPGPILLVGPSGSKSRYVGNLSAVEFEYDPTKHWTTAIYYSHFANGRFLKEAGRLDDLNYVAGWVSFHF